MALTTYPYSKANDFPGGAIDPSNLWDEISASDSGISIQLDDIIINPNETDADLVHIVFKDALPAGEKTILDADTTGPAGGLIAVHDSVPAVQENHVIVDELNTHEGPEDSLRVYPAPNRLGFYRCDRDIKLLCGVFAKAASFEDMKVDVYTNKQTDWNEVTQVGIYKMSGEDFVPLVDDTEESLAVLTVWDFHAHDQTLSQNIIPYDIKGGQLKVAPVLDGDKSLHRFYAILAPYIPSVSARIFDTYLERDEGKTIESVNEIAVFLNPTPTPELTRLRLWVFYPAGSKVEHIFRIIAYRPLGTF